MEKLFRYGTRGLIAATIAAALVFAVVSLGMLDPMLRGVNTGPITELRDGWTYTVNEGGDKHETALPATLILPDDARRVTLTTTLPDDIKNGDALRFQTLLGWYRIYIDGELRLSYGNEEITERYLMENGSNMLLIEMRDEDAGKTLRVETGYQYANYLAQQRAPTLSTHRDLLMGDIIGSASGMLVIFVLVIFALALLCLWMLLLIKSQSNHLLAGCAAFLLMGAAYYNVGNMFQCELWGYPENLPMYNDFIYYMMEFLIPVAGYQLVLSGARKKPSRALGAFLLSHTIFACAVVVMQMLWIGNLDVLEYVSAVFTVAGYVYLWLAIRPTKLDPVARKFCLPVFVCIFAYLLDYYKLTGLWWPLPESWVTYLQVELPFMAFFPPAMMLFLIMTMIAMVEMLIRDRVELKTTADIAQLQVRLAEREYYATMENIIQIRQARHDISHHLTALSALAEQGSRDELVSYLSEISEALPDQALSSHNFITASFLEHYRTLCHDVGIRFEENIVYDESCLTKKTQLGILLGNALKNAYEAAQEADGPDRFISVEGRMQGEQLVLIIKNTYNGVLDEQYRSTKRGDRGLGLSGMRSVTERHNGYLSLSHTDTVFTLKAVLIAE